MSLKSLLMPTIAQRMLSRERLLALRAKADKARRARGEGHVLHYFHQVDDPYSALVAGIFLVALHRGMPEAEARALTFFALVLCIVGLIFVNRSFSASIVTAFRRRNVALRACLM